MLKREGELSDEVSDPHPLRVLYRMVSLYLSWDSAGSDTPDAVSWSPSLYGFTDGLRWAGWPRTLYLQTNDRLELEKRRSPSAGAALPAELHSYVSVCRPHSAPVIYVLIVVCQSGFSVIESPPYRSGSSQLV